ncbi:MAG: chromosome segregation protein SMC, partial [Candidatus Omnitrophica bacterium]|nr:chromosome segregation protein SMC [Candidatus Omnitrophota bacterium]
MRVKQLEVLGFKSFAKKTTIHFEPGVTAIVGPNGSGKTNVVDAIRWVLGEHNPRDIRAPRLEDVIFNGTDRTAPLSMAEVSLTIDNEQGLLPLSFTEVAVTRRVYRSGESECFINQSPCRLKDIHELFLGTGLGGGTYAIIEQGHIDMVLSSKPEERRVVFEEASGVAKYLAKKQETVRRLDEVEEHLIRIADIITEVRRQVGALERAANKARQYKSQWDELKQLELLLAVDELSAGASRDKQLEQELEALNAQRHELEREKGSHVSSLEGFNTAVSAIQNELQGFRTKVVECASQIEQHEGQRALKTRWIEELAAQAKQLEAEEVQLRARVTQLEEHMIRVGGGEAEIRTQLATVQEQHGQADGELASLETALQEAIGTVNAAKAQLFEAASEASHLRNRLADVTSRLQGIDAQLARLDGQRAQQLAHADELRQRYDASLCERDALKAQHDEIQCRVVSTQQALEALGAGRQELTDRLHRSRDRVANERARVTLLEDVWRRYEGFPETVKALLGRSIDGLIGPLVDLVQAAPGYEALVEAALGPLAEALVVRDREALAQCREALSAQQLEGCRFLVLSDCPAGAVPLEHAGLQDGVTQAVRQHVRAEPTYQPLVDWLLNDSWVIEDMERLLRERIVPQGRLVSARGDRWDRRSWRLTGAQSAARGRLGRKHRWEEARAGLDALEQAFSQLEAQAARAEQEWQSLVREQESAKGRLAHAAPSLLKFDAHLQQLRHALQRADEEHAARELDIQELTRQRDELQAAVATARRATEEAETRQQTIERS